MEKKPANLQSAYAIETPDDNKALYADWADTYDSDFVAAMKYQLPQQVASAYVSHGGKGPVLDVGAGTGAVGVLLHSADVGPIDGTDISAEMLDTAREKCVYQRLFTSDVTQRLDISDDTYGGITSAGTFTLGHVGPEPFDELLRITRPGGLLVISINKAHFVSAGFDRKIESIKGKIADLQLPERRIYGPDATGDHADDTAVIAVFRKA